MSTTSDCDALIALHFHHLREKQFDQAHKPLCAIFQGQRFPPPEVADAMLHYANFILSFAAPSVETLTPLREQLQASITAALDYSRLRPLYDAAVRCEVALLAVPFGNAAACVSAVTAAVSV
jgi:hypothetical protein